MERRLLKEILLDQRAVFEKKRPGTRRDVLAEVGRHMGKPHAITLAGVRRCGKSTLLRQIAERFLASGYHYCHFEDERLLGFQRAASPLLNKGLSRCSGEPR